MANRFQKLFNDMEECITNIYKDSIPRKISGNNTFSANLRMSYAAQHDLKWIDWHKGLLVGYSMEVYPRNEVMWLSAYHFLRQEALVNKKQNLLDDLSVLATSGFTGRVLNSIDSNQMAMQLNREELLYDRISYVLSKEIAGNTQMANYLIDHMRKKVGSFIDAADKLRGLANSSLEDNIPNEHADKEALALLNELKAIARMQNPCVLIWFCEFYLTYSAEDDVGYFLWQDIFHCLKNETVSDLARELPESFHKRDVYIRRHIMSIMEDKFGERMKIEGLQSPNTVLRVTEYDAMPKYKTDEEEDIEYGDFVGSHLYDRFFKRRYKLLADYLGVENTKEDVVDALVKKYTDSKNSTDDYYLMEGICEKTGIGLQYVTNVMKNMEEKTFRDIMEYLISLVCLSYLYDEARNRMINKNWSDITYYNFANKILSKETYTAERMIDDIFRSAAFYIFSQVCIDERKSGYELLYKKIKESRSSNTLEKSLGDTIKAKDAEISTLNRRIDALSSELDTARNKLRSEQRELAFSEDILNEKKARKEAEEEAAALRDKLEEYKQYIDVIESSKNEQEDNAPAESLPDKSVLYGKRYLIVGCGINEYYGEAKNVLRNSIFIESKTASINTSMNIDGIVYLTRNMAHSLYFKIRKFERTHDVKVINYNGTSSAGLINLLLQEEVKKK